MTITLLGGTANVNNVDSSATITGDGNLIINGAFNWLDGNWLGSGWTQNGTQTNANATLTIQPTGTVTLGRTLTNYGVVNWSNGDITDNNAVINNQPRAAFNITCDKTLSNGGSNTFLNQGTLTKNAGTGHGMTTIDMKYKQPSSGSYFYNSGKIWFQRNFMLLLGQILVYNNAVLTIDGQTDQSGGAVTISNDGTLTVNADYDLSGGSLASGITYPITVTGNFVETGGSATALHLDTSSAAISGGTYAISPLGDITTSYGVSVTGTGALDCFQNGRIVGSLYNDATVNLSDGAHVSNLVVTQGITLGADSEVYVALAANHSSSELTTLAAISLGGVLNLVASNGFVPSPSNSFTVMGWQTYSGTLYINAPPPSSGHWQFSYDTGQNGGLHGFVAFF